MRKSIWPATLFYPERFAATRLRRGHVLRSASVAVLRMANRLSPGLPASVKEIRPLDMPELRFAPSDSMVMESVYWYGACGYEGILGEVWKALCARSNSILEIGGNVGLFTVIGGMRCSGRYTVVEPLPSVAAMLRENLRRNRIQNVEVLGAAAVPSGEPSMVEISIPDERREMPVGAHLLADVEISGRSESSVLHVQGLPIRSLIEGRDLVKIDAEGIEARLIGAAEDIIARDKPTIVVEVLPEAVKLGEKLRMLAQQYGYRLTVVPAYGSDEPVEILPEDFSSKIVQRHRSKDVVLSQFSIADLLRSKT